MFFINVFSTIVSAVLHPLENVKYVEECALEVLLENTLDRVPNFSTWLLGERPEIENIVRKCELWCRVGFINGMLELEGRVERQGKVWTKLSCPICSRNLAEQEDNLLTIWRAERNDEFKRLERDFNLASGPKFPIYNRGANRLEMPGDLLKVDNANEAMGEAFFACARWIRAEHHNRCPFCLRGFRTWENKSYTLKVLEAEAKKKCVRYLKLKEGIHSRWNTRLLIEDVKK